jgi:hypothetical protein
MKPTPFTISAGNTGITDLEQAGQQTAIRAEPKHEPQQQTETK